MPRPRKFRRVRGSFSATFFKPVGVPLCTLEEISLTRDEAEALRLKDVENLDQTTAAEKMKVSQSTFQRILSTVRRKVSAAIVGGKAIRIETGEIGCAEKRWRRRGRA